MDRDLHWSAVAAIAVEMHASNEKASCSFIVAKHRDLLISHLLDIAREGQKTDYM